MLFGSISLHLHSTLFILKHIYTTSLKNILKNLHSTLFILKLKTIIFDEFIIDKFTFYSIYIKTIIDLFGIMLRQYLHSTLFILKL